MCVRNYWSTFRCQGGAGEGRGGGGGGGGGWGWGLVVGIKLGPALTPLYMRTSVREYSYVRMYCSSVADGTPRGFFSSTAGHVFGWILDPNPF